MDSSSRPVVEIAPFHLRGSLKGFVVSGRWPDSTKEWAQLLMAAVRVASVPGLLPTTTIFGVREELPERSQPGTVGLVLGRGHCRRRVRCSRLGRFADRQPPALMMLHPPSETTPSLPECSGAASGCVLLPGSPSGPGAPRRLGRGRSGRHRHRNDQSRRGRSHQPSGHRHPGDAARRLTGRPGRVDRHQSAAPRQPRQTNRQLTFLSANFQLFHTLPGPIYTSLK